MRARSPRVLACALLLLAFAGCRDAGSRDGGGEGSDIPEADRYGGTMVIGGFGDLQGMNPLTSSDNNSNMIQRNMLLMTLVRYDENIEFQPYLAERWDTVRVAPDSLELTWHIRRDVRWHDGTPTTGEDVLFSYQRLTDPATAFPNLQAFEHYDREAVLVDPYTVRMRLQAHAEFMDIFTMVAIAPRHLLGDVPPAQLIQHPYQHEPVGNGPFRFVRRAAGQEWVFDANPDFPEALGGRPYVDRVVYRLVPEMTTLLTELINGRIDIYLGVGPHQAQQVRDSRGVELVAAPSLQWTYLAFNTRRPTFSDARTRRAIAMAIDRRQIVDALAYGFGEVGRATVPPTHWGYDADATVPYDTAAARALLAEAGWRPGPDGILRDPQGRPFRFTVITNQGNDLRKDISEYLQAQLRPLGIAVQPRLIEWTTMIQTLQGTLRPSGERERNFDAVIGAWVNFHRHSDAGILHSRNMGQPYQYVGYANPRTDALIDSIEVTLDRDEARRLYREHQRLMVEESPYVTLYYPQRLVGVSTRLRNFVVDTRGEFTNAREWWIHPSARRVGAGGPAGRDTTAPGADTGAAAMPGAGPDTGAAADTTP
jgi:peptide/nickel transport system substrate-binding protein